MTRIEFFLELGKEKLKFPVNPEKLHISSPGGNESIDMVKLGEVNILKEKRLSQVSIESYFPKEASQPAVLTKNAFKAPSYYLDFIKKIRDKKSPVRLVISGLKVDLLVGIENFEHWVEAQDDDVYFKLDLKEYQTFKGKTSNAPTQRDNPKKAVTLGCKVTVNGRLHRDSYGAGPGAMEKNAHRKVNFIKKGRKCPYHVTTTDGGWRGWVTANSVVVV